MPRLITASAKQRKFVQELIKTGDKKQAALKAYDVKEERASSLADLTMKQPATQAYMKRYMERQGLTPDSIAISMKKVMDASTSDFSLKQANPAHAIKLIELYAKLADLMPAEKKKIEKRTINYNLKEKSLDELKAISDGLVKQLKSFKKITQDAEILP